MKMIPANVEEQYRKFPEMKREEVLKLMQWLKQQPHMPNLTELDAILFFHACHYSMELTKRTIDTNLTIRTHCPEFFHNLDIERSELKRAMSTVAILPLPKATPEGYRVIIAKIVDTDTSNFNFADIMKFYCTLSDFWNVETGIELGYILVLDMQGATLGHIARVNPLGLKKFLLYLQEASAIRLVGFHFINITPFVDKLLALIHPFMNKHLRDKIQLQNSLDDFYKDVPKEMLPSDYGGPEPECVVMKEIFYKKMMLNREALIEYGEVHQLDEKLRPGTPRDGSNLFGVEGNFRKLEFD